VSGSPGPAPALLRGIDRAAFATALAVRLRGVGIAVGFSNIETFADALQLGSPDSLSRLYWTARITLVHRHVDLDLFDAVFAAVFADAVLALDPNARRRPIAAGTDDDAYAAMPATSGADVDGAGLPWITRPSVLSESEDSGSGIGVPELLPSDVEALADTPFEEFDTAELAVLSGWLESALVNWPTRKSRRLAWHRSGRRIALRATFARARRTGWEPIEIVGSRPTRRPRRLVMLCDVSQSMQAQATAYLHLMRAAVLSAEAEVFAFGTTLTRLTAVIAHRSPVVAIELATAKVTDRFGGTRIAANLRALLTSHHGGATRGAVVIIASDGWDSDDPADLAAVMAKLRRRAHRVIWLNPRAAAPGYEPLVGAMAAALPHCDELLPAHNIRDLAAVIEAISHST
jgi:uncharacterized protein